MHSFPLTALLFRALPFRALLFSTLLATPWLAAQPAGDDVGFGLPYDPCPGGCVMHLPEWGFVAFGWHDPACGRYEVEISDEAPGTLDERAENPQCEGPSGGCVLTGNSSSLFGSAQVINGAITAAEASTRDSCCRNIQVAVSSDDSVQVILRHISESPEHPSTARYKLIAKPRGVVSADTELPAGGCEITVSTNVDSSATDVSVQASASVASDWGILHQRSSGVGVGVAGTAVSASDSVQVNTSQGEQRKPLQRSGDALDEIETETDTLLIESSVAASAWSHKPAQQESSARAEAQLLSHDVGVRGTMNCDCGTLLVVVQ